MPIVAKNVKSRSNPQKGGRSTVGNAGRRGEEKEEDINVRFAIKPIYLIIQKRKRRRKKARQVWEPFAMEKNLNPDNLKRFLNLR